MSASRRSLPLRSLLFLLPFCVLAFFASPALGQDVPSTDLWLAPIFETADGPSLGTPENLTNREGYDNQPAFSDDGSTIYFTSQLQAAEGTAADGTAQTDLFAIDLDSREIRRLTETPESEYSPTPIPGERALSSVRVEADGAQRLWRFPLDGSAPSRILEAAEPVGYHAWSGDELVLFVLGEPHELRRASAKRPDDPGTTVARSIGRALHKVPAENAFSFVEKVGGEGRETWWIQKLDVETGKIERLLRTLPGREDLAWSPRGMIWSADGAVVHRACPACGEGFAPVTDLSEHGIGEITRLAISPDGRSIVFVATR